MPVWGHHLVSLDESQLQKHISGKSPTPAWNFDFISSLFEVQWVPFRNFSGALSISLE